MKRLFLATIVLLFATSAWGASSPRHGDTDYMSSAPINSFTDTTSGDDDYRFYLDSDIFYLQNRDAGGNTTQESWEFKGDGDFVLNGGGLQTKRSAPFLKMTDTTVGDDDYLMILNLDVLYIENHDVGGSTTQETWQFQPDGDFVIDDGNLVLSTASAEVDGVDVSAHAALVVHTPSYASIFASNVTVTINTTNTDTLATSGWTLNETSGPSYNPTTGIITIQSGGAGVYDVDFSVSVSGQSNAAVHYHLHAAGAGDNAIESHRKLSGGDVGNAAMSNLATFAVGDTVKVMTQQDTGTGDQTLEHGSFSIIRISP
jgi:hypothetical protein